MLFTLLEEHPKVIDSSAVREILLILTKLQINKRSKKNTPAKNSPYPNNTCTKTLNVGGISEKECSSFILLARLVMTLGFVNAVAAVQTFIAEASIGREVEEKVRREFDFKNWIKEKYDIDLSQSNSTVEAIDKLHGHARNLYDKDLSSLVPPTRNWTIPQPGGKEMAEMIAWLLHMKGMDKPSPKARDSNDIQYLKELDSLIISVWMRGIKNHLEIKTDKEIQILKNAYGFDERKVLFKANQYDKVTDFGCSGQGTLEEVCNRSTNTTCLEYCQVMFSWTREKEEKMRKMLETGQQDQLLPWGMLPRCHHPTEGLLKFDGPGKKCWEKIQNDKGLCYATSGINRRFFLTMYTVPSFRA